MRMKDAKNINVATDIGTTYDLSKKIEVDLNFTPRTARFIAKVSVITVKCINLSSSSKPSKLYLSISEDVFGDDLLLTESETDFFYGLTTSSKGTGQFRVDGILSSEFNDTIYCHLRSDQGTFDLSEVRITWEDGQK